VLPHPRAFSEDEYQACSGIGHGADKKTVVVKRKDPAEASQVAEKLRNSVYLAENTPPGLKAPVDFIGVMRGLKPPPPSV
jgi:hypothetical protein